MTAIDFRWTPTALKDVIMALEVSLGRVAEDSIRQTAIADNWRKTQEWLQTVRPLANQSETSAALEQIPPFPLTGQELRALHASIDRIAQAHAAASPTQVGATAQHVHQSFLRLRSSANVVGLILIAFAVVSIVNVAFFLNSASHWYFYFSVGSACVALAFWTLHYWSLGAHRAMLKQAHPLS